MRIKLTCVVLAIGAMWTVAPSHAQTYDPNYPVCAEIVEWGGNHIDSSFTSLTQRRPPCSRVRRSITPRSPALKLGACP